MNEKYNLYYLSTSGRILGGIAPPKAKNIGLETTVTKTNEKFYYMPKEYDTLYLLSHLSKKPFCCFKIDDRISLQNDKAGNFIYVSINAPTFIIANKVHANITLNQDNETFTMLGDKATQYWIDKNDNFSVREISGFRNDYFGFVDLFDPWRNYLSLSDDLVYKVYASNELKQQIEKSLTSVDLDHDVNERITQLYKQINENDNPVLLIGKLKGK